MLLTYEVVYLTETRDLSAWLLLLEKAEEGAAPLDIILKRKLGTRQQADCHRRSVVGGEAARGGALKACRYEMITRLSRQTSAGRSLFLLEV